MYIEDIANPAIVSEVERRLALIDVEQTEESGEIGQLIEDSPWSPFPTIQSTERPDKVASAIIQGRVTDHPRHSRGEARRIRDQGEGRRIPGGRHLFV